MYILPENLPTQFKALREQHKLTLAGLGAKTGLSISYLSDLEHGRSNPSIDTLEKIANAYGMEISINFVSDPIPDLASAIVFRGSNILEALDMVKYQVERLMDRAKE